MLKISVIIPNYNNTHYLGHAIQSVLNQTFVDYEIIVIDDGSTDNSKDVVNSFGDKVGYIWQENTGLAGARNTGIRASRGELIALLDADDEWHSDYLEQMVMLSEKFSDAQVFYCMAQCMDEDGHDLPQLVGGPPADPKILYQVLLRANFIIPSTVMFRRKPIIEAGYFDGNLRSCEDWDLWLRILPAGKIVGSSNCLVRYRVHGSSLSTNLDGMHSAARKVIEKHFGLDDDKPSAWTSEKRRAYGGVYRYQVITFIQRQNNWNIGATYLAKALIADPSLATDLNMFYDLALGTQPSGYRGTSQQLNLDRTILEMKKLLDTAFSDPFLRGLHALRMRTFSTAYHALGLVAYNSDRRPLSRMLFLHALKYSPKLIFDSQLIGLLFKSFLSKSFLMELKKVFS